MRENVFCYMFEEYLGIDLYPLFVAVSAFLLSSLITGSLITGSLFCFCLLLPGKIRREKINDPPRKEG